MLTQKEYADIQNRAAGYFLKAGIVISAAEKRNIEVADFGLGEVYVTGLELLVYVNTERVCAKELVLFPGQTCPEHRHPMVGNALGKEETFRCRWGLVYLYVPGEPAGSVRAMLPHGREKNYTVFHEIVLHPGEQYTLSPDTLHWFQSGPEGAVVSEFSTSSKDQFDIFTDTQIKRFTEIVEA